jgi:nucleoside-diphosphate-sugar epimerase
VANAEPEKDLAEIKALAEVLVQAQVKEFILISTVDVYPKPIGVNEDSSIDKSVSQAYGLNRLWLEEYIAGHFANTRIIRLPGLFGPGLRKNAIYDFINDNNVDKIHQDGVFQFYNTARLWQDIETIRQHDLRLVNISSEPVSIQEIADQVFKQGWTNTMPTPGPRYDYWSKHAPIWNPASEHYMFSKEQVLEDIKAFVAKEPRTL